MENQTISIYCPYCHRYTAISKAIAREVSIGPSIRANSKESVTVFAEHLDKNEIFWWIGVCNFCGWSVLVNDMGRIYPNPLPAQTDNRIPKEIRKDIDEAKLCFSVGAYQACAIMVRRGIQMACINKGSSKNDNLEKQINFLYENGMITKDVRDWANSARWIGNSAAHPDSIGVDKADAEDILRLGEQFLHILFVTPSIAQEQSIKRGKSTE